MNAMCPRTEVGVDTDALPPELVCLILERTDRLTLPVLRHVNTRWHALIDHLRASAPLPPYPSVCIKRRLDRTTYYSHECTLPSRCATYYARCSVKRSLWGIFEWFLQSLEGTAITTVIKDARPFVTRGGIDVLACARAAADGDLQHLRAFCERGFRTGVSVWCRAARYGHMHVLEWLCGVAPIDDPKVCKHAAKGGHLDVLRWLVENRVKCTKKIYKPAAKRGHMHIIEWAHARGLPPQSCMCAGAALHGHIDSVQWGADHGCPIDQYTCRCAASGGHLPILEWAHKKLGHLHTASKIFDCAAEHGHLHILRWLLANGYTPGSRLCSSAASGGHTEILRWARTQGYPWDEGVCWEAARGGHLETLRWARANGCPWNAEACMMAVRGNHMSVLQWVMANGCPVNIDHAFECAATCGGVATLRWLYSTYSRPAVDLVPLVMARSRYLSVIRWARSVGCPWDPWLCSRSACNADFKILVWAIENGCPWDRDKCLREAHHYPEIVAWIRARP